MTHMKCSQIQIPYFLNLGLNYSQIRLLLQAAVLYFLDMGEDGEREGRILFCGFAAEWKEKEKMFNISNNVAISEDMIFLKNFHAYLHHKCSSAHM